MTLFLLSAFLSHLMIAKILSSLKCSVSRLSSWVPWSTGFLVAQRWRIHLQSRRPKFNPWAGRSPGEGHGYPLHYSCLENPMDRGGWWATVQRVAKSRTRLMQLSTHARTREHRLFSPCPSLPLPSSVFVLSMPFYCVACSLSDPDLFFSHRVYNHPVK